MDFPAALEYLYARLPMFHRIGAPAFRPDLVNIEALCAALGNPERGFRSIHVAGTNGKGSVSSMLTSILMESGYKVGLLTSPHLKSFTERIRINGKTIPEDVVADFVTRTQGLVDEIQPSFFELTTAMAFEHFAHNQVDIAVIEVGMGGRRDSTNVITPELSVITNISWDHQKFLGDTLALIAGEKAGIIKQGVSVVIGEDHPETRPVFEQQAAELGAMIEFASDRYTAMRIGGDLKGQQFQLQCNGHVRWEEVSCDLPGYYQRWNIPTAVCAADHLERMGWNISQSSILQGIANASLNSGLKGRMTLLRDSPRVIADIAHNEAGVREVLAQIAEIPKQKLRIVWGMVEDKDWKGILELLPKDAKYYFVKPDLPRGLHAGILAEGANAVGLRGVWWPSVVTGYWAALSDAQPDDLIYVGGSTFVVAEVI